MRRRLVAWSLVSLAAHTPVTTQSPPETRTVGVAVSRTVPAACAAEDLALGGTLRRDTSMSDELLHHHAPDDAAFDAMFDHRHKVDLVEGGLLASAYAAPSLEVNSVHYQGIGALADSLAVEARAPDGLVEAYSARPNGAPLLAVQWHPEWATDGNDQSQTYFHLLGRALRGEL